MSIVITDHRTIHNEADAITNWTGAATLFTADPDPVESTGNIGYVVSNATVDAYPTQAAVNLTNRLIYAWVLPRGAMDTLALGGVSIHLGDGTNRIAYHRAGSNVSAFRHESGPVFWQCVVLDTSNRPTLTTTRAGVLANLNITAITQLGVTFKTLSKAIGGISNCFVDIIRYGDFTANNGAMITISSGTVADPGTFADIALLDRSTGNQQGYGIVRELGSGLYGVQGGLRFGSATTSTYFKDNNVSVAFEDRGLSSSTAYTIYILGNATTSTTFQLGNKVGTGNNAGGNQGCSITVPPNVGCSFVSTDTNVNNVFLYGSTLSGFSRGVQMRTNQEFIGSVLTLSGTFEPNGASVINSTISSSINTTASLVTSVADMNNIVNTTFSSNNRALKLTSTGTYSFVGLKFSNNTFDIENASTGLITINTDAETTVATFTNTNGGSTVIIATKSYTIKNIIEGTEIRIFKQSDLTELGGAEVVGISPSGINNVVVSSDTDNPGRYKVVYSYNYSGDIPIFVVAHSRQYQWLRQNDILTSSDKSLTIVQLFDRQYDFGSNP